jgi:hypothetical protein
MGKVKAAVAAPVTTSTPTSNGGNRTTWQGFSACALFKWFGANGYTKAQAATFAASVGLTGSGSTLGCQYYSGRALGFGKPQTHPGKAAVLLPAHVKAIGAVVGSPAHPAGIPAPPVALPLPRKGKGSK